jgi:uncharacterized protein (DUF1501 family)
MTPRAARRRFLRTASLLSLAGAAGPLALNLAALGAASAQTGGYKALVCLFMIGGNDHYNTLVPYDAASYADYANARSNLALSQASLTATEVGPVASQGGRDFAFHPALGAFKQLYAQNKLAVVANVGPLVVPTTRAQYQGNAVPLPPRLMAHDWQVKAWQVCASNGPSDQPGWGGRIGDMLAHLNANSTFTAVSPGGSCLWLAGQNVAQFQASPSGALSMWSSAYDNALWNTGQAYQNMITSTGANLLENQIAQTNATSIAANALLASAMPPPSVFGTPTPPGNAFASQLNLVARLISARSALGSQRQVFMVALPDFDFHANLLWRQNQLLQGVNDAVAAFQGWIGEMGLDNQVTLFTASDFGRTLNSNGQGSDHGWGSHHFAVGGAVQGGTIYGQVPLTRFGVAEDIGNGVLVPTTAVDQYAATFARWLGVADGDIASVLPNIGNFGTGRYLGFMG